MRYVVRFNNGYWKVRDLLEYTDAGIFGLQKLADQACDEWNIEELANGVITKAKR